MKKIKNIFILLALIASFAVTIEAKSKNNSQKTVHEVINKQTMEEELALADEYSSVSKLLKAKAIYEKYSSVNDKAKLSLAVYYMEDLQKEKALKLLEELAKKKDIPGLNYLASIYLEDNATDKLEKLFNPKNKQDMKKLAELYSNNGYSEKASEIHRNLASKGDKDSYFKMISSYSDSAQIDLLLLESSKGNTKADEKLGYLYYRNDDSENSIKHLKKYLKKSKGNEEIFNIFGYNYSGEELTKELAPYIKRGDEGAKEVLEYYASYEDNDSDEIYHGCGHETEAADDGFERNEKYYLDRFAENENNISAIDELFYYYLENNEQTKSNNLLNTLINDGFYLGDNWEFAENPLELYKNYVSQGINRAKPVLADIYLDNNDFKSATAIYEELIDQRPSNNDFLIQLGVLYNKTGQYNKTLDLIKNYRADKKKDQCYLSSSSEYEYETWNSKSVTLNFLSTFADYKLGNLEKAKDEYTCLSDKIYDDSYITSIDSKNPDFYYPANIYLLDIYKQQGDEENYRLLEESLLYSDKNQLADYYTSKGNFQKAKDILKNPSADASEYYDILNRGFDFQNSESQIIKLILKYKDYNEIRPVINEILSLTNNSYDNSFYYFNSLKIASTYSIKNNKETPEFFSDILKKYSNSSLKSEFRNSYKNLYKNKKGISFYPDFVKNDLFLSQLLSEWNINTETLDNKNNANSIYIKNILAENISPFFIYKHSDLLKELISYYSDDDELQMQIKKTMDKFSKINNEKDYKEFYELVPTIIITDIQEKLKKYQRQDLADKIQSDYKKYLSEDKMKKLKDIKKFNEDYENINYYSYPFFFTLF